MFFVGGCTIFAAAILAEFLEFKPLVGVGSRELGHFIGFIGMSFMMYFYAAAWSSSRLFKIMQAIHLPFIILAWMLLSFPSIKPEVIPFDALKFIAPLSILYALFSLLAFKKPLHLDKPNHFILISAIFMCFVSGYWELIHQPLLMFITKDPEDIFNGLKFALTQQASY